MLKTVLVTGANRGIGLGLCRYWLAQGARVIAACRRPESVAVSVSANARCSVLALNMSSEASIKRFAAELAALDLRLDLLINNAGVTENQSFGTWTQAAFMDSLSVNAVGPALLVQAIEAQLAENAKLVQMSSGLASISLSGDEPDSFASYAVSKVALNMLTKKLSAELPGKTVLAMSPGWVQTDMGGSEAPETVEALLPRFCATIETAGLSQSGSFIDADGQLIAW